MKKLLSLIIVSFLAICAFADDGIFVEGKISKENATNTVDLMIETSKKIQAIGSYIYFPKGVKPVSIVSTCDVPVGYNYIPSDKDGENYLIISYLPITGDQYIWPTTGPTCVGKITVEIDDDFVPGNYEVVCCRVELSDESGTINPEDGYGDLIVQKTAVIEPLTDGYSLEILPFVAKEGASTIDVLFKSAATAKSVTFDIELPQGMMFYDENFDPSKPVLNASACTKVPTVSLNSSDETPNVASVSVMGTNTGAVAVRKYINKLDELTTLVSIPVYVVPADNIEEWGEEYELKEGVYTAKLNNIVVTDYASNTTFTGNYIASVIAGQPSAQEAILYGNYNEATASAFTTALKNVAIADVTAATVDDGVKFEDVLVNKKGGYSYYTRTSENYGTTVLPLDLTTANVDKLYTVVSMDAKSIVLTEAENVPANTPCIFKGTINVEGATPTLGVPSEQGLGQTTFKGTYEAMYLGDGAGYYISSEDGKFYGDGASIRPFRGYFDGAIAGAKALQVLLEDETGIKDITDQFSTEEIYNLMGVKMNNANKGVNIINGKKVYIK